MKHPLFATVAGIICAAILAFSIVVTSPSSGGLEKQPAPVEGWIQQPLRLAR